MRSMKLLVAAAVLAALVSGPVLAEDAMMGGAPASTDAAKSETMKPAKHKHKKMKKHGKHHAKKESAPSTMAPEPAPAAEPAQ